MTDLARRSAAAELMDTDCTDAADYAACLRDLARVNTLTLARRPTLAWLDRAMRRRGRGEAVSVYDVAYGHGDMLRAIARWARRRGRPVRLGGVDLNPGAAAAARAASPGLALDLQTGDVLAAEPARPDYIVSSLFTHHLTDDQVVAFLRWMEAHAGRGWFVNDLHRHAGPAAVLPAAGPADALAPLRPARRRGVHRPRVPPGGVAAAAGGGGGAGRGALGVPVPPLRKPAAVTSGSGDGVVIVGGGPAGAAAACRLGRRATLLERERGPAHKVCGEFISGEAVADLAGLGVDVAALGASAIGAVRLVHRGRVAEARLPFRAAGLSRRVLDEALLARAAAAGAAVHRGVRVRSAAPGRVQTDAGAVEAPALLLATGKHDLRGLARQPGAEPEALVGFKLHLRLRAAQQAALAGHVEVLLFAGGYAGLQLVEDGVANLCLLADRARYGGGLARGARRAGARGAAPGPPAGRGGPGAGTGRSASSACPTASCTAVRTSRACSGSATRRR